MLEGPRSSLLKGWQLQMSECGRVEGIVIPGALQLYLRDAPCMWGTCLRARLSSSFASSSLLTTCKFRFLLEHDSDDLTLT
jgi:hypothetical protein